VARHLHNRGVDVTVALTVDPARYAGDALVQWRRRTSHAAAGRRRDAGTRRAFSDGLVIDAIFGTGLSSAPREPFPRWSERSPNRTTPSSPSTSRAASIATPVSRSARRRSSPTAPVTFVAPKAGFANPAAAAYLGEVIVGDIGCPREAIARAVAEVRELSANDADASTRAG
jgi:NAD(P)H-hydrate epimerase